MLCCTASERETRGYNMDFTDLSESDQELGGRLRTADITQNVWPVLISNVRHLFAVTASGLEIAGTTNDRSLPWDEITGIDFGTFAIDVATNIGARTDY